ncbi:tRNA (guanosine(37)-N1)-methyltransferase TrmD [Alcaligenaceae bacterium C4P045]|nr:tRNA (guanosine(37)-N1)-methyltransferase TrmD [Alcaligenaceae bacterium C4P045]
MRFDVVTLFPEMFGVLTDAGVTGRAHGQGRWLCRAWNPRTFTQDVHRTVDDRPYGGGPGMVMMPGPLRDAVAAAQAERLTQSSESRALVSSASTDASQVPSQSPSQSSSSPAPSPSRSGAPVILLSPTGPRFDQQRAQALVEQGGAILICGRYEGVDQRFVDAIVTEQISLGDFVLSGGEIAAMAVMDAAVRLIPGVLNDDESARQDSFHENLSGLLDSPHYTRPESFDGVGVPAPLLSGHHAQIARWRRERSLELTSQLRPDLIRRARKAGTLTAADEAFLKQLVA